MWGYQIWDPLQFYPYALINHMERGYRHDTTSNFFPSLFAQFFLYREKKKNNLLLAVEVRTCKSLTYFYNYETKALFI